ncbi:hypothetical protein SeMB42_g06965 [Synchytrium endobioticum]|uniref:VWFA domain-containing protein n=1 Tax=Synchytrium endobioticum TaxID=286115 RepID=A0A507CCP4_9FUNG|nr:hypothetical protein SeMB42_g06965 [Synchytrium endobioticum]
MKYILALGLMVICTGSVHGKARFGHLMAQVDNYGLEGLQDSYLFLQLGVGPLELEEAESMIKLVSNFEFWNAFLHKAQEQGHAINVNPEVPREEQQITVIIVTSDTLDFVQPLDLLINGVTDRHRRQDMDFSVATIFNVTSQGTTSIEKADRLDPVLASYWNSSVAPDSRAPKRYLVDVVLAVSGDVTFSKTHTESENFEKLQEVCASFVWAFEHLVVDRMWSWESWLQHNARVKGDVSSPSAAHKLFRRGNVFSLHLLTKSTPRRRTESAYATRPDDHAASMNRPDGQAASMNHPSTSAPSSQEVPQNDHRGNPRMDFPQVFAQSRHASQHYVASGQHTSPGNFHRVSRNDAHTPSVGQSAAVKTIGNNVGRMQNLHNTMSSFGPGSHRLMRTSIPYVTVSLPTNSTRLFWD